MLAVGVTFKLDGIVVAAPAKPYFMLLPAVPPVCVNVPAVIFVGLDIETELCCDKSIIFPALSPAPLLVALVLILPTLIAVAPVPPLEINTLPPSAVVLDPLESALALMAPALIAPEDTRETLPATPLSPVAFVVTVLDSVRLVADVVVAEFVKRTSPPLVPLVFICPIEIVAELEVLPVQAVIAPPVPPPVVDVLMAPVVIPPCAESSTLPPLTLLALIAPAEMVAVELPTAAMVTPVLPVTVPLSVILATLGSQVWI